MTVVGVDLGGTKIAAATVDRLGRAGPVRRRVTPAKDGPDAVLDAIAAVVDDALAAASLEARPVLRGVGIGAAGVIDPGRGLVLSSTDAIADWSGTAIATAVATRLGLPAAGVTVHNDVDAHALGETWTGAAAGVSSALVVAVGTGIGGAWWLGEALWVGERFTAGEIGHMPTPGAGHLVCACGRTGHLEALGSGPGLYRHYLAIGGDAHAGNARDVVALAATDSVAARAVSDAATAVGRAVAGLVTAVGPEVVVVTGGVPEAGPVWWQPFESALRDELIDVLHDVPVRRAALGELAAVIGSARRVWEALA